ncbi:hypothetical protein [Chitinophaga sp. CF418]|uniref:baeRF3 domain-containing protein n=1 Tax=Chitinophaga sp. CF418 TaxID=1855287 RepID=UPI00090F21CB|nr:hypothetical protein [Chitinophaga sp. CF418]SHN25124.1 hypothetical protein SAMN05216311_107318 [Chitinophaga sp. CF418]
MTKDELSIMQQQGTNAPYVTIIVSLQETGPLDKKAALLIAGNAIQEADDFLQNMYPKEAAPLLESLRALLDDFDQHYDLTAEGLGFYVSPGYSKLVKFFFPVQKKVDIGDAFSVRELLYLEHYAISYMVLHVNEKAVQCYKGRLNSLEEVNDGVLPRHFHDDYEYNKPAKAGFHSGQSAVQGFEGDKSTNEANRVKSFYRETDQLLSSYLGDLPLVVVGPQKDISMLQDVSAHQKNIITTVNGNYSNVAVKTLEKRVWQAVKSWIDEKQQSIMLQLIQEEWQHHAVDGMRDVWAAVNEGRGYRLIVEKDYTCPAFIDDQTGKLHLRGSKKAHHIVIDAVDQVLRLAIEKGGDIVFVNNGALDEHEHISLITRY